MLENTKLSILKKLEESKNKQNPHRQQEKHINKQTTNVYTTNNRMKQIKE